MGRDAINNAVEEGGRSLLFLIRQTFCFRNFRRVFWQFDRFSFPAFRRAAAWDAARDFFVVWGPCWERQA